MSPVSWQGECGNSAQHDQQDPRTLPPVCGDQRSGTLPLGLLRRLPGKGTLIHGGLCPQQCLHGLIPLRAGLVHGPPGGLQIDDGAPEPGDGLVLRDLVPLKPFLHLRGADLCLFGGACGTGEGLAALGITWMSHGDYMEKVPEGFALVAHSDACPNVAICDESRGFYGVQYHPEVNHTEHGTDMIRNFLYEVCGAQGDWTMGDYKETAIRQIREKVGDGKVLLALSGGVDSSVAAALVAEAVGSQLTCVFVDHGLMRLNEGDEVEEAFKKWDINFVRANAEELFLSKLSGVSEPERKRKIIGEEFIRVFEAEAKKIGQVDYLVQGTIYPDVIESGTGDAAVIKSHHNVGGLPDYVDFKEIIEPLRMLFKDEVRSLGRELGLPEYLVMRQPFPGPGLAIRVIGEVTKDKLDTLRLAAFIFRAEIAKAHLEGTMNQYFAVLTNMRSVGVMGDGRTYDYTLALRSVTTTDFMTADWTRIPYEVLDRISVRIVNEVPHINRIVYDITSKPPATIEWE